MQDLNVYLPKTCPKCGGDLWRKDNQLMCRNYLKAKCSGHITVPETINFVIYSSNGIQVKNDSVINCMVNNIEMHDKKVKLHEGAFGIEHEDGFIPLAECEDISIG